MAARSEAGKAYFGFTDHNVYGSGSEEDEGGGWILDSKGIRRFS
jgi:hypothetical protein